MSENPINPQDSDNSIHQWDFTFQHKGREYRLYKRKNSKVAPYYLRIQQSKKRFKQSLGTPIRNVAIDRAKTHIDNILERRWALVEKVKLRHKVSTLEDVLKLYRTFHGIKPRSARNNELAMIQLLRVVTSKDIDPRRVSLSAITPQLAIQFQDITAANYCAAVPQDDGSQREARERAYRSTRSTLNQARSLFTRRPEHDLMQRYRDAGVNIPDSVKEFMTVRLRGTLRKADYHPPGDDVIKRTFERIEELKPIDLNVYKAFWLDVGAGLRRSEITRCEWSHFVERDGMMWISGGIGKDGEKINVPIQSKAWEALKGMRGTGPVIVGEKTEWSKRLNHWLRFAGWTTEKKMHELRAYVGSLIYRKNPQAAMAFMRHKSIRVTEQFYVRYGAARPVDVL